MKTEDYILLVCETIDFKTVLEVGSGFGGLTDKLLSHHAITRYVSCDPDIEACEFIQNNYYGKHTQLTTFSCKFENFMVGDTKFDLVLTAQPLESTEILNKMCNSSNKYVIHICTDKEQEKFTRYWKRDDWAINNIYTIDNIRRVFLAEKI